MIPFQNKYVQLDDLLDRMAESLQLDKTRYELMIQHYEAIKKWIEADEQFFKPFKYELYPHGSVRIRTTVKPIGKDEFDLDIALHLKVQWDIHTPEKIYFELRRRLSEHAIYKEKMELKNRCIRLNYSGDFHMDILPGVQENDWDEDKIRVPDRLLGYWVSSNPRGYSKWFLNKANIVKISLLEKALRAENLPSNDFENKKPLQRAVQLIKRYRDIYFHDDDTFKTSSIILTTIAGLYYNGEESIYLTVENIVNRIRQHTIHNSWRLKVLNPVNSEEDFTDKWEREPRYYQAFETFCEHLYEQWQELKKENGIISEGRILKGLFGDELYFKAQTSQADIIEKSRNANQLGINRNSGIIGAAGTVSTSLVKTNTFFGNDAD
ncbi:cyclic GMP-AMP synthase DncV-like nucleotidyltransferase [Flavobacterium sp. FlaQc-30]|uniref:SMODS domain-containing nucleotidyltransferase n=1 Tax=Flavobacterium sp. FlaQc-30 TaxID=3374179 RepID=UPI003757019E